MLEKIVLKKNMGSKIFLSILKSILMIIPIPIIIILALELVSINTIEKIVNEFEESIMSRVLNEVNSDIRSARTVVLELKRNETLTGYMRAGERNYWTENQIQNTLEEVANTYGVIGELYIYFEEYDYILSTSAGCSSETFYNRNYSGGYEEWISLISQNSNGKFLEFQDKDSDNAMLLTTNVGGVYPYKCQIVLQLNETYLRQMMENLKFQSGDQIFLSYNDRVMVGTYREEDWETVRDQVAEGRKEEVSTLTFGDEEYQLRYTETSNYGISIVHASPDGIRHTAVTLTRTLGVISICLCVGLLIAISVVIANKNYSPILYLFNVIREVEPGKEIPLEDYNELENYVRNSVHTRGQLQKKMKEYEDDVKTYQFGNLIFRGICKGNFTEQMREWKFTGKYFAILMCAFEGAEDFQDQEEDWRKDILNDYVKEYFSQLDNFYILNENGNYYCLLNGGGTSEEEFQEAIKAERKEFKKSLEESEGFFGEIYVNGPYSSAQDIHEGYEKLKQKWEVKVSQELRSEEQPGECTVDKIVEIVRADISNVNLSVSGIAEKMNISSSYLSRFFKLNMGMGVLDYIHQTRIEMAKEILKSQEKVRIKEVASTVGFYNISTFIRVFKKVEGITPGQYQEMLLGK